MFLRSYCEILSDRYDIDIHIYYIHFVILDNSYPSKNLKALCIANFLTYTIHIQRGRGFYFITNESKILVKGMYF